MCNSAIKINSITTVEREALKLIKNVKLKDINLK
jgi:hypothetical protein